MGAAGIEIGIQGADLKLPHDIPHRKIGIVGGEEGAPKIGGHLHREIADAMQQNMYLQREITAARELYNDTIDQWTRDIFAWPTKKIVAAKNGYTTRIPFAASKEIKEKAKGVFF